MTQPDNRIFRKGASMKSGLFAAGIAAAVTLSSLLAPIAATTARATDLDVSATEDADQSRFIRIGLNKSVVLRLPAEAKEVIVGNPSIVDAVVRTKNTAYLFAKATGQTNIFFFDAEGRQILALDLEVALDMTAVKKLLNRTLPGNRITVDTANNNVILGGVAANPLEAKTAVDLATQFVSSGGFFFGGGSSVINAMKIAGEDQVMLKVKVVEIQRDVMKQFGINFTALLDAGKFAFNLSSVNPFGSNLISPFGGYKGAYKSGGNQIEGLVRAMESDGLVRTLAEPNLTALSGESSQFRAGGEFPYKDCPGGTFDSCTIKFKEFGVSVDFTPTVLDKSRINLKINTEVSELSNISTGADNNVPAINKRGASTVLEMPSGGTMMIAGLIRENTRQNIAGTPGLKKLPVLGTLFRSRDFVSNETELVIFVTPYLVRPTAEAAMTSPDQNFNPATDRQAIFLGRLNKVYGGQNTEPTGSYHGNVGFIVE